MGDKQ